jgi:hypothetical protein
VCVIVVVVVIANFIIIIVFVQTLCESLMVNHGDDFEGDDKKIMWWTSV